LRKLILFNLLETIKRAIDRQIRFYEKNA